ncbi:type IX secretion system membrane protein PorP/SprF [Chitinophaga rhizophila]|uniref:Type IX secretion system membrane protein PorP/SprF n=1 Tax=Chitinophaga rhizophila TaxID=2866212 RepID=A0ABS7GAM2_9BACT|nr:type IX secretion system membrane protein PorP/SprF [Chitinophaga rhizophila]MBW8684185.1 type IX secretion system membrane protein PorP/SprF [Chitinophaga rhizophila]
MSAYLGKLVPPLICTAGYSRWVKEYISLLPSVMIRYLTTLPVRSDMKAGLQYRDRVWVDSAYRHHDSMAAMVGINITAAFNIGYAYNYRASGCNIISQGFYEIVTGMMTGNRLADLCPRNLW